MAAAEAADNVSALRLREGEVVVTRGEAVDKRDGDLKPADVEAGAGAEAE